MISEQLWYDQFINQLIQLHARADCINNKTSNGKCFVKVCIVDAVDLEEIDKLSSMYQQVHLVSEQSIKINWPNVTLHLLPCNMYGIYYLSDIDTDIKIEKQFNCFLNRNDPVRQTWFYMLYTRELLDQGYVSFNMHQRPGLWYPSSMPENTFDVYHKTYLSSFDQQFNDIKKIVPYKNFVEPNNLCEVVLATKFSIVVETYFERPDCQVFSEKTWRVIQLPRPWLLFAATGCVQKLRDMGFDVFDDYVNHDYDQHNTALTYVNRQEGILSEAHRLLQLEVTPAILDDWNKKALHNRNIMKNWSESWPSMCKFQLGAQQIQMI